MLDLKELNFLTHILKHTLKEVKDRNTDDAPHKQSSRLYGDAMMGLNQMGILPENEDYFLIDGEEYPIPGNLKRFIRPDTKVSNPTGSKKSPAVQKVAKEQLAELEPAELEIEIPSMPEKSEEAVRQSQADVVEAKEKPSPRQVTVKMGLPAKPDSKPEVKPEAKPEVKPDTKPEMKPVSKPEATTDTGLVRELHEPQAIVDRHRIKLTNVRNPSDVSDLTVTVMPLSVSQSSNSADIAVEVEKNGKLIYFVSEGKGRKTILADIDGTSFSVRGQWTDGQFQSTIFLIGNMRNSHKMADKVKKIRPEIISEEFFRKDFVRKIGDSTLYILPFDRINEPGGQAKCVVVQETGGGREISADAKTHVLLMYIDGLNFRVYAKWDVDKQYEVCIDQME